VSNEAGVSNTVKCSGAAQTGGHVGSVWFIGFAKLGFLEAAVGLGVAVR
jgi:hypothetical protein